MDIRISAADAAVLALYLAAAVFLGAVGALMRPRGESRLSGYLLGGRDLPWWAILGSIVATETSTATFLSVPGLAFAAGGDFRFLQLSFGYIIGRILVVWLLLPGYFKGRLFTAYEVLQERFGGTTKRVASALFLTTRNLGDGLRLFLTALALERILGLSLPACAIVIGAATILYTVLGGMRSVVWNDCVQLVLYMIGGVLALWMIIGRLPGGSEQLWTWAAQEGKLRVFDFGLDFSSAYTIWAGLIGGAFLSFGTHGADQMMVQRLLCARNQRDAGRAMVLSGVVVLFQFALFLVLGAALACFYSSHVPTQPIERGDQALATFLVEEFPAGYGLIGLMLAAVLAAAMSTLSSSLNSSAAAVVNDFLVTRKNAAEDSPKAIRLSRALTVVFGVIQIVVAIMARDLPNAVVTNALAIAGFSAGILLGVFLLGILAPRVGGGGALIGMLAGLITLLCVKFAPGIAERTLPDWRLIRIAWPWYPVIGACATIAAGWLASFLFRGAAVENNSLGAKG